MSIKVILWDIDGTLLSFEKAEKYAIRKCFELFDLGECSDEMLSRYSIINIGYWEMLERGEIAKSELLVRRFIDFFTEYKLDASKAHDFNSEYQIRLGDKIFFMDGAKELLEEYKGRYKQYVVTNGTIKAQARKLAGSGIGDIVDGCFISDEIGHEKPTSGFFKRVWDEIGDVDKKDVIIIGDSLTSDIKGGVNEGIITCWFNPKHKDNNSDLTPDYEISELMQLQNIIK